MGPLEHGHSRSLPSRISLALLFDGAGSARLCIALQEKKWSVRATAVAMEASVRVSVGGQALFATTPASIVPGTDLARPLTAAVSAFLAGLVCTAQYSPM